ncbi:hypothetical protein LAZ67_X003628 [Cordylochernes scorpioides]|uniref:Uncharacterized protein n=1 Tax=Cordylochernes scorpioides TaxID=51811 RepID=A0ABY6LU97_9ARAC|nr:hypothetical protein LAZ67_X003628 [Cordylochernes scorpioides]
MTSRHHNEVTESTTLLLQFQSLKKCAAEFKPGCTLFEDDPHEGRPNSATTLETIEKASKVGATFAECRSKENGKQHLQQGLNCFKKDPKDFVCNLSPWNNKNRNQKSVETVSGSRWFSAKESKVDRICLKGHGQCVFGCQRDPVNITPTSFTSWMSKFAWPSLRMEEKSSFPRTLHLLTKVLAMRKMWDYRYDLLGHPPYSPDLHFAFNEEVERAIDEYFNSLPDSFLERNNDNVCNVLGKDDFSSVLKLGHANFDIQLSLAVLHVGHLRTTCNQV